MKIVIQCAARKNPAGGTFLGADGRRIAFVARPGLAPREPKTTYARPDDDSGDGRSWRKRLLAYNKNAGRNPLGFLPAHRLYAHSAYGLLVDTFGVERVFILSAGWGLIPAAFLTPPYDITFSASADPWKRRRKEDPYDDVCLMRDDADEIFFFGGQDYLPLFCRLMTAFKSRKTVFFNSTDRPALPTGFTPRSYPTRTRTNWHYECVRDFAAGRMRGLASQDRSKG